MGIKEPKNTGEATTQGNIFNQPGKLAQVQDNGKLPPSILPAGEGSGDVVGAESSVDGNFVAFDGEDGKVIKDSGVSPSDFAADDHNHSGTYEPANANIQSHISDTSNPHSVTKAQVGLSDVKNINWGNTSEITANYTLQDTDNGKVLQVNSASSVTITIPDTFISGYSCSVIQTGAGQVTFEGAGDMTIRNRQSHTKIAGQYGCASLYVYAANNILLGGDTAA